jgi:hypothetical protein
MKTTLLIIGLLICAHTFGQKNTQLDWPSGTYYYIENKDTTFFIFEPGQITVKTKELNGSKKKTWSEVTEPVTRLNKNTFSSGKNYSDFEFLYYKIADVTDKSLTLYSSWSKSFTRKKRYNCYLVE